MDNIEKPKICRYCGNEVVFVSNSEVYGKEYFGGKIYLCRNCTAYVGTHKGTDIPLGTLANEELRKARNLAHMYFDKLWRGKTRQDTRYNMYGWLAKKMNLPREETHIAMFEKEQCEKVVELAKERLKNVRDI